MVSSRREQWIRAGAALGVAALIAPVAVLGFPCLLAFARPLRGIAVGVVVAVSGYLPFVLLEPFGMFGHVWVAVPQSLPYWLGVHRVTWTTRLVQAAVVAGGCAAAALRCRGRAIAIGIAPLVASLLRIATDPMTFRYYWMPVAVASTILVARMPPPKWWWPVVVAYVAVLSASSPAGVIGAFVGLAIIAFWLLRTANAGDPAPPPRCSASSANSAGRSPSATAPKASR